MHVARLQRPIHARRAITLALALVLVMPFFPAVASATPGAPAEIRTMCLYQGNKVYWGASPADCKSGETVLTLPTSLPVYLCAEVGRMPIKVQTKQCPESRQVVLDIPAGGPYIICAKNRKNGQITAVRAETVYASSATGCPDAKYYTPYVTPAPPVAQNDAYAIDEDTLLSVPDRGVLENDTDYTGGPIRTVFLTRTGPGALDLRETGGFTFDPRGLYDDLDLGQSRTFSFTYAASDGELSSTPATVTVTVTGRNDAPVGVADAYSTNEDTSLSVIPPGVVGNDTDAESHTLTARVATPPAKGALTLGQDGSVSFTPGAAFQALGAGQSEAVGFTYVARDGSADSAATPVSITVTGVNDAPVAVDDTMAIDENSTRPIDLAALVANDTDAEGSALTVVDLGVGNPSSSFVRGAGGSVTFDPRTDFDHLTDGQTGFATLTYRASDGVARSEVATLTIAVTGISPAIARDDVAETREDLPVEIDVLANDQVAGATLEVRRLTNTLGTISWDGSLITYDPAGQYDHLGDKQTAIARFSYVLTNVEGESRAAIVSVVIEGKDTTPVAFADAGGAESGLVTSRPAASGVLANDFDPDTPLTGLSARLVAPPLRGRLTLGSDGSYEFDPAGELVDGETVTFRYRASDGTSESQTATVILTIGRNTPPRITSTEFIVRADLDPASVQLQVAAVDDENDAVGFALDPQSTLFTIDSGGVIRPSGALPGPGTYPLSVRATDTRGLGVTATVQVRVVVPFGPADDTYQAVGNTRLLAGGEQPEAREIAVLAADGPLADDGAQDGTLRVTERIGLVTALCGRVTLRTDGAFAYDPPAPDSGASDPSCPMPSAGTPRGWDGTPGAVDSFPYEVTDAVSGETRTALVSITLVGTAWYVDSSATGPSLGRGHAPFTSLSALVGPVDPDAPGQTIHLRGDLGQAYDTAIVLEDQQVLTGEGVDLVVGGVALLSGDPTRSPSLNGGTASAPAVGLARGNVLRGFEVDGPGGIGGADVGALLVDLPRVRAKEGPALDLGAPLTPSGTSSAVVDVRVPEVVARDGVALRRLGGTVTIGSLTTIQPVTVSGNRGTVDITTLTREPSSALPPPLPPGTGDALIVAENVGAVRVGSLSARTAGTAAAITDQAATGRTDIGAIDAQDGTSGLAVARNAGAVAIGSATMTGITATAIDILGNDGTVEVSGGTLSPSAGNAATLVSISGGRGITRNRAAIQMPAPTGTVPGRVFAVDGITGEVEQRGPVTWRGPGVRVTASPGAPVRFLGGMDVTSTSGAALFATQALLGVTGATRLTSIGGPALRLSSVQVAGDGIAIAHAVSDTPAFVGTPASGSSPEVAAPEGEGYGLYLVGVTSPNAGVLRIAAGSVSNPARGGVLLSSSTGVVVGAVQITDVPKSADNPSAGTGVLIRGGSANRLEGTVITRADTTGILTTDAEDTVLSAVQVADADGVGIHLHHPIGDQTRIEGSTVADSLGVQVLIEDEGSAGVVSFLDSIVRGTEEESDGIVVDAKPGSRIDFRTGGITGSGSFGGRHAINVLAGPSTDVRVAMTRTSVGNTEGDGIRLHAEGVTVFGVPLLAILRFDLHDMSAATGGGINIAGRSGIDVFANAVGLATGGINRVDVSGARQHGVRLEGTTGVLTDQLAVRGPSGVGVGVVNSQGTTFDRLQVEGAPGGHGVQLWGVEDITITRSRVDLRALGTPQAPNPAPSPPDQPITRTEQTCTNADYASNGTTNPFLSGVYNEPFVSGVLRVRGVAGIFARHVGGELRIDDTTVRGATLHQIVVHNGPAIAGVPDPEGLPAPSHGQGAAGGRLVVQGLELLDSQPSRTGLFAGAGGAGQLAVAFGSSETDTAAPILLCAADGGTVSATGTPVLLISRAEPGLILKSSGFADSRPSRITYALNRLFVQYADDVAALPPAERSQVPALATITQRAGEVSGTLTDTTIANAPGDAFTVTSGSVINGLTIVDPAGDGFVAAGTPSVPLTDVEVNDLTVTGAGGHGISVTDAQRIAFTGTDVAAPTGSGVWIRDAEVVSFVVLDVSGAGGASVDAAHVRDLSLSEAALTENRDAQVALRARNVLPLRLTDLDAADHGAPAVDVHNGATVAGRAQEAALPCAVPQQPCAGQVSLHSIGVAGTPAGEDAVRVSSAPGVHPSIVLTGASVLDGPLSIEASGIDADVQTDPLVDTSVLAVLGGDAVQVTGTDAARVDVSLHRMRITYLPLGTPGTAVLLRGVEDVLLSAVEVEGAGTAVDSQSATVHVAAGEFMSSTGDALRLDGPGAGVAVVDNPIISSAGGHGMIASGWESVATTGGILSGTGLAALAVDRTGAVTIGGPTISGSAAGIATTAVDSAAVSDATITDTVGVGVSIAAISSAAVTDVTISGQPPTPGTGAIVVRPAALGDRPCTDLSRNTIPDHLVGFDLEQIGLPDLLGSDVDAYLRGRGNDFLTVRSADVLPC